MQINASYLNTINQIKELVYQSKYKALRAINKELLALYWEVGNIIVKKQEDEGWGRSVVEQIASELKSEFPGIKGFSASNLWRMRNYYNEYRSNTKLATLSREIPWWHNIIIFEKCKDSNEREFYLNLTIKFDLSHRGLGEKLKQNEYQRYLANQTNFDAHLEEVQAKRALLTAKDDYNLDFLLLKDKHSERELEDAITTNILKFLAEMGGDYAFIGRQYPVYLNEKEYFIDLLFYHRELKCLIAVELKTVSFEPEYAGKMQFYLSLLDDHEKKAEENSSIGIIICEQKDRDEVEYTLRYVTKPIGVGTYNQYARLEDIPEQIAKYLPSESGIEKRLGAMI